MELIAQLGVNWQMLTAQAVNFLIVMAVLTLFVFKPLLRTIDKRNERIRLAMEQAKRSEEETAKLAAYRMEKLKKIDDEYGVLLASAKSKAEEIREKLLKQAKKEADAILEKGRRELNQERAKALNEIHYALGKAAVDLTESLLKRKFSSEDQQKIMSELSDEIPALLK